MVSDHRVCSHSRLKEPQRGGSGRKLPIVRNGSDPMAKQGCFHITPIYILEFPAKGGGGGRYGLRDAPPPPAAPLLQDEALHFSSTAPTHPLASESKQNQTPPAS